jgi:hypothetical protein
VGDSAVLVVVGVLIVLIRIYGQRLLIIPLLLYLLLRPLFLHIAHKNLILLLQVPRHIPAIIPIHGFLQTRKPQRQLLRLVPTLRAQLQVPLIGRYRDALHFKHGVLALLDLFVELLLLLL